MAASNASLIIGALGVIAAVVFFAVKAIAGHIIAHFAMKKINAARGEKKKDENGPK